MKSKLPFLFFILLVSSLFNYVCAQEGRGGTPSGTNPLYGAGAKTGTIILYAYALPGEQIDWNVTRTRATTPQNWDIQLYSPLGPVASSICAVGNTIGNTCNNTASKITVGAGEGGLWTLVIDPRGTNGNDAVSYYMGVYTASSAPVLGRVYTNELNGLDASSPVEPDFTLNVLTPKGYQYSATFKGLNGLNYTIISDKYGVRPSAGACVASYQSVAFNGGSDPIIKRGPDSSSCGERAKLFFNPFSTDLPASAPRFNIATGTGQITEPLVFSPSVPSLSAPTFTRTGICTQAGHTDFTTAGYSGTGTISYDNNNDGDFNDPEDRIDTLNFTSGANTFAFDGLDGNGNFISISQPINIQVGVTKPGETHFVMNDIEILKGGIEVTKLNGIGAGDKLLYWDDTQLPVAGNCSTTPIINGNAGVNSTGGIHGWGACDGTGLPPGTGTNATGNGTNANNGTGGSWGDSRLIDNWVYLPTTSLLQTNNVPAVNNPDFGDLPTGWPLAHASSTGHDTNGDCILDNNDVNNTTSVWAGASEDFEATPNNTNINATSDIYDDGLGFPPGTVDRGSTYMYTANINSNAPGKTVYYAVWYDWNNNGDFGDDVDCNGNPAFYTGSGTTPAVTGGGITSIPVSVCVPTDALEPGGVSSNDYKVRFIVSDAPITAVQFSGTFSNGEVEDYQLPLHILPVTFGAIKLQQNNCTITLSFETIYEYKNNSFTIQNSNDGVNWHTAGTVKPLSTGNALTKYSYNDADIYPGKSYYRILQMDVNGKIQYSKTVSITNACNEVKKITSFPNPVKNDLTISIPSSIKGTQIKVTNAVGQTIKKMLQSNSINTVINTQSFSPGVYLLQVIKNEKIIYYTKIIKQ